MRTLMLFAVFYILFIPASVTAEQIQTKTVLGVEVQKTSKGHFIAQVKFDAWIRVKKLGKNVQKPITIEKGSILAFSRSLEIVVEGKKIKCREFFPVWCPKNNDQGPKQSDRISINVKHFKEIFAYPPVQPVSAETRQEKEEKK